MTMSSSLVRCWLVLIVCVLPALTGWATRDARAQSLDPEQMRRILDETGVAPDFDQMRRFFDETGYVIEHDMVLNYFRELGGVSAFGYPISRTFPFAGTEIQIFQRHVIEIDGDVARSANLLDPQFLNITRFGGLTFPGHDPQIARAAPAPATPAYGQAVAAHIEATVPNTWEGLPVSFRDYFYGATTGDHAVFAALETWGFPTSRPARDPNNHHFVYQRFQRGVMHFDARTSVTKSLLAGQAFKRVLTGRGLPPDLAEDVAESPLLRLYDADDERGFSRSPVPGALGVTRENTNLSAAFEPHATIVAMARTIRVYLVAIGDAGRHGQAFGCSDSLVPVDVQIEPTMLPVRTALEELFALDAQAIAGTPLTNALERSQLRVDGVLVDGRHASVYLSGRLEVGGTCEVARIQRQIEQTVLQFAHIDDVSVFFDREPLEHVLGVRG